MKAGRVAVHREAARGLGVEGAQSLADPAPELHARRHHHVGQRVALLERCQVHGSLRYDHAAPPSRWSRPRPGATGVRLHRPAVLIVAS